MMDQGQGETCVKLSHWPRNVNLFSDQSREILHKPLGDPIPFNSEILFSYKYSLPPPFNSQTANTEEIAKLNNNKSTGGEDEEESVGGVEEPENEEEEEEPENGEDEESPGDAQEPVEGGDDYSEGGVTEEPANGEDTTTMFVW